VSHFIDALHNPPTMLCCIYKIQYLWSILDALPEPVGARALNLGANIVEFCVCSAKIGCRIIFLNYDNFK